jgi:hypothetical protein
MAWKKAANPRQVVVSARLTREEKRALDAYAKKRGVALSEIVRERLLGTMVGA